MEQITRAQRYLERLRELYRGTPCIWGERDRLRILCHAIAMTTIGRLWFVRASTSY